MRQEEKGTIESEMVGWHHQLDVHEFEQTPGVGDGQRSLITYRLKRLHFLCSFKTQLRKVSITHSTEILCKIVFLFKSFTIRNIFSSIFNGLNCSTPSLSEESVA